MNTIPVPDSSSIADPLARADAIREYIVGASVNAPSAFENANAANIPAILAALANGSKPGILCGSRALAMLAICAAHGIAARQVDVFTDPTVTSLASHTFVEVFVAGAWTIQDPTFDLVYLGPTGRLSTVQVMGNLLAAVPTKIGSISGWGPCGVQMLHDYYFRAAALGRLPTRFILAPTFDAMIPYKGQSLSFRTYAQQNFHDFTFGGI